MCLVAGSSGHGLRRWHLADQKRLGTRCRWTRHKHNSCAHPPRVPDRRLLKPTRGRPEPTAAGPGQASRVHSIPFIIAARAPRPDGPQAPGRQPSKQQQRQRQRQSALPVASLRLPTPTPLHSSRPPLRSARVDPSTDPPLFFSFKLAPTHATNTHWPAERASTQPHMPSATSSSSPCHHP